LIDALRKTNLPTQIKKKDVLLRKYNCLVQTKAHIDDFIYINF